MLSFLSVKKIHACAREFKRLEMLFDESVELRNFRLHEIGDLVMEATNDEYKTRRFLAYFVLSGLQNGELLKAMVRQE
jgi:ferritin